MGGFERDMVVRAVSLECVPLTRPGAAFQLNTAVGALAVGDLAIAEAQANPAASEAGTHGRPTALVAHSDRGCPWRRDNVGCSDAKVVHWGAQRLDYPSSR